MTRPEGDAAALAGAATGTIPRHTGERLWPALPSAAPLRLLWLASLLYSGAVVLFFQLSGQDAVNRAVLLLQSVPTAVSGFFAVGGVLSIAVLPGLLLLPAALRRQAIARLPETILALFAVNLMFGAFGLMKLSLPQVVPFHADALLARIDAGLHFGVDPWRLTHAVLGGLPITALARVYLDLWLMPAMFLPVLLTLFDGDRQRRTGYTLLWLAVWIVLGTLLAAIFMSGGPVYHDRLVADAGERFADLAVRLAAPDALTLHQTQEMLWQNYLNHETQAGGGISAFPSVHVGMATVIALYLCEVLPRRPVLGQQPNRLLPGLLLGFYLVMSVHLGWHYAIDGYASILILGALAFWLRRGPWARTPNPA
jgi:hypothetical protein